MYSILRSVGIIAFLYALVACNSSSSSVTNTTPSNATSTTIKVTWDNGEPIPKVTVKLSTGYDYNTNTATGVITSDKTDASGSVTFSNLPRSGQLCVSTAEGDNGHTYIAAYCKHPFPATYTLAFGIPPFTPSPDM
jgi:hypothetical protein